jgi:hypothetical protein
MGVFYMAKNLADIYVGVKGKDPDRHEGDFYPTPPIATHVLTRLSSVPERVIEPCAGRGNIAVELARKGHDVRCFDLIDYQEKLISVKSEQNVLDLEKQEGYTGLVTNPPYHKDLPRKILEKALGEYDYVAMFLRLTFLEGKKRQEIFSKFPPTQIIFFSDRLRFLAGKREPIERNEQFGGMIAYAWFIWRKEDFGKNTKCDWVLAERDYFDEWREWMTKRETVVEDMCRKFVDPDNEGVFEELTQHEREELRAQMEYLFDNSISKTMSFRGNAGTISGDNAV